jgi:hypothetical protein
MSEGRIEQTAVFGLKYFDELLIYFVLVRCNWSVPVAARSKAGRLLGLWVRIPLGGMIVCLL